MGTHFLPEGLTDDDLAAQALAADPDQPLPDDAVPFPVDDRTDPGLLPGWYMPAPVPGRSTPGRRAVAIALVAAAVVINALGFCITYGSLTAG